MKYAPIVLFVYNRPHHTQKTIESLLQNHESNYSDIFIFSDGPKKEEDIQNINEVRSYIKSLTGFKSIEIIARKENIGLANSIIKGVTEVVNKHGSVIVLEDDMVVSKYFLKYMNESLNSFENIDEIISINAYLPPIDNSKIENNIFLLKGADCWGWATWKRGWNLFEVNGEKLFNQLIEKNLVHEFNFNNSYPYLEMLKMQIEGKISSWAIRWQASAFVNNKLSAYPKYSMMINIGNDGSGTHSGSNNLFETNLHQEEIAISDHIKIEQNTIALSEFEKYYKSISPNLISKLKTKLKHLFSLMR